MTAEEEGYGSIGEVAPTLLALLTLSIAWGLLQHRDGTFFVGLAIAPPLAVGMLASATVRMAFGRSGGGGGLVGGIGAVVFVLMFGIAAVLSALTAPVAFTWEPLPLLLSLVLGTGGAFLGSLALAHMVSEEEEEDDDDYEDVDDGPDIDYSTEPEDLVCLLTNQVVNRAHDAYVVCHNRMNQTQVCHAVYLKDYVHLLEGRCRRCYQGLRERDLKGMRR
jgi:hypothetical protein